jgi:YegS/Rv2252/BmrU family lipid kinase
MAKVAAIVNPASGRGDGVQLWSQLLSRLPEEANELVTWTTEGPGHAELLAGEARRQGFERVIAAGGDGTLFEVLNGLWWEADGRLPILAMVPLGTACDYLRSFRPARDRAQQLLGALRNPAVGVAVGAASLRGLDGSPLRRVFLNILGAGYDGRVTLRMKRSGRPKRGKTAYLLGLLRELVDLKTYQLHGEIDGEPLRAESIMLAACLGRYFGGGMMIAPGASPAGDRFQVLWSDGGRRLELLGLLPRVYQGRHPEHPIVRNRFARHLRFEAAPPAYVEAEGELVGQTPVELDILPNALQFVAT